MCSEDFRHRRHDATAEILLDAAQSAIARKGYEAVTMRDIAAEAGCSPGTLYLYFKNKGELVNALIDRCARVFFPRIEEALARAQDPLEKLHCEFEACVEFFNENRDFFRVLYSARPVRPGRGMFDLPRGVERKHSELCRKAVEIIREAQKLGEIRCDLPAESIERFMRGLALGVLGELTTQDVLPSKEEQMKILWGFLTEGIGARRRNDAKP